MKIEIHSLKETQEFAIKMADLCRNKQLVITLDGDLGAGKTTWTKSFGKALGVKNVINSPTFTILKDYKQEYEECVAIVPSLRVDVVISKIINTSRGNTLEKIKNNEIYLNYELLTKPTYSLKENDIFSIRKYGKYKFIGIVNETKKGSLVIKYLKYI